MSRELEEAVELHTRLDKIQGLKSPNFKWPPYLSDYYIKKVKEKENADTCRSEKGD